MLNGSTLIKGRWKIVKKIGAGAFGPYQKKKTNERSTASFPFSASPVLPFPLPPSFSYTLSHFWTVSRTECCPFLCVGEIYFGKNIISSQQVAIKVERADSKKQVVCFVMAH
jgi:hypothetical protein